MLAEVEKKIIPGLPETAEEALLQIEEVECSSASEWLSLENVLDNIERRYEVYASLYTS